MKIYLVRHAQSKPRDNMTFVQSSQVELSDFGITQAKKLSKRMQSLNIERIISSPFPRARQTAEAISNEKIKIEYDERLIEHAPSKTLVGPAFKEAKKQGRLDYDFVPTDGESFNFAADRFISALNDIVIYPNKNVCVVSHALVMEAAFTKLFILKKTPEINEASLTLINYEKGVFKLIYINKTAPSLVGILKSFFKKVLR